jgi:hypothetical protein
MGDEIMNKANEVLTAFREANDIPSFIEVWINGKVHKVVDPNPQTTLLEYLRSVGLTGTKLGCGEVFILTPRMIQ